MERDDIHEQAAAYVLNALPDEDRRIFEAHLARCTVCNEELASLRRAAASLAFGAETPEPPADLRARLLERARAERPAADVVPLRRRAVVPALAAAAACAALGLGLWAASLSSSLDHERAARAAAERAAAIVAAPDAARYRLAGANGAVVVTPAREAALVVSARRAAGDKAYEIWVIAGEKPEPAGLFRGGGRTLVALTRRVPRGAQVAVTIEPRRGSKQPTGPVAFRVATA